MSSCLTLAQMAIILDCALRRLLETNTQPSASEAVAIKATILDYRMQLAQLPRYYDFMDTERTEIQRSIYAHEALLAPARYLPMEVLMEIFSYTVDGCYDVLCVNAGPWVLTHVCRSWRAVASAFSELWTSFVLPWENLKPRRSGPFYLLDSALARSKDRVLSITYTPETATPSAQLYYQRLLSEAHRWRNVRLNVPDNVYECFTRQAVGLPHLETLDLVIDLNKAGKEAPCFFEAFDDAPRLSDIALSGTASLSAIRLPHTRLPWQQLKRFCTEHICSVDHLIQILNNTPNLEELEVLCLKWHYPKYADSVAVHEGVRSLRLWDPRLLDYLVLPAMHTIELEMDHKDKYATALVKFVQRSECAPRKLRLANGRPEDKVEVLKAVPTLTHLTIDESFNGRANVEALFRTLTRGRSDEAILPKLEHFEWIADISTFQFDGKCMLEMIESRWRVEEGTRLRSVRISCRTWRSRLSTFAMRRLARLKNEGLDVNVSFDSGRVDQTWLF